MEKNVGMLGARRSRPERAKAGEGFLGRWQRPANPYSPARLLEGLEKSCKLLSGVEEPRRATMHSVTDRRTDRQTDDMVMTIADHTV